MGIFDFFRSTGAEPVQEIDLGALGLACWSEDAESWCGKYGDLTFYLAYERASPEPAVDLVAYCQSTLIDDSWLLRAVEDAKSEYLRKWPQYQHELATLKIESLRYSMHNSIKRVSCQLGFGQHDRFWVVDFIDGQSKGLGFDT